MRVTKKRAAENRERMRRVTARVDAIMEKACARLWTSRHHSTGNL
jgi:hypothetical protein